MSATLSPLHIAEHGCEGQQTWLEVLPGHRDMSVEDAIELGLRSIYHATFRDAVSGGTVSGVRRH